MSNIRITQQLSQGYNPDGTPGTVSSGVAGPGPTDAQVATAVSNYLTAHPTLTNSLVNLSADPVQLGPGSKGSNDVAIQVGTQGTKDGYLTAVNGSDPLNTTGRTPINLHVAAETGGTVFVDSAVTINGGLGLNYTTGAATITAQDKIAMTAPLVTMSRDLQTQGNITAFGNVSALGSLTTGQFGTDPGGLAGFNTVWARSSDGGLYYKNGTGTAAKIATEGFVTGFVNTPDPAWTNVGATGAPPFENGWVNLGGTFALTRYRMLANSQVELQGTVKSGTIGFVAVFTLPVGYRPSGVLTFTGIGNNAIARFDVQSDGRVCIIVGSTAVSTSINCTFYADH